MKLKKIFKKNASLFVLGVLLLTPTVSNAQSKYVSLTMYQKSASAQALCPFATIKGGAMNGGEGIDYEISTAPNTLIKHWTVARSGSCKANTSFSYTYYGDGYGWSGNVKLKESQHNTSKPGIGWGRIDY